MRETAVAEFVFWSRSRANRCARCNAPCLGVITLAIGNQVRVYCCPDCYQWDYVRIATRVKALKAAAEATSVKGDAQIPI